MLSVGPRALGLAREEWSESTIVTLRHVDRPIDVTLYEWPQTGESRVSVQEALARQGSVLAQSHPDLVQEPLEPLGDSVMAGRAYGWAGDGGGRAVALATVDDDGLRLVVATTTGEEPLDRLREVAMAAARPEAFTVRLGMAELRAACHAARLPMPPVGDPGAERPDEDPLPKDVADALIGAGTDALLVRGWAARSGDDVLLGADLREALEVLAAEGRTVMATVRSGEGTATVVVGGAGQRRSMLTATKEGLFDLWLAPVEAIHASLCTWLLPDVGRLEQADVAGGEWAAGSALPSRHVADEEIRAALRDGTADGIPDVLERMVSIRGMASGDGAFAAYDAIWLVTARQGVWALTEEGERDRSLLTPVGGGAISAALREALGC